MKTNSITLRARQFATFFVVEGFNRRTGKWFVMSDHKTEEAARSEMETAARQLTNGHRTWK